MPRVGVICWKPSLPTAVRAVPLQERTCVLEDDQVHSLHERGRVKAPVLRPEGHAVITALTAVITALSQPLP